MGLNGGPEVAPCDQQSARREVTNEEMEAASKNPDYRKVVKKALRKYEGVLSPDDLRSCGLMAIWKALQYHKDGMGKKFTTNLTQFVDWEVNRTLRKERNYRKRVQPIGDREVAARPAATRSETSMEMSDLLKEATQDVLTSRQRDFFGEYFWDRRTMVEISERKKVSKENVRMTLKRCVRLIRQYAEEHGSTVYVCDDGV